MPQPPPPQNPEPGQNTEQPGRPSGTPPRGAPPAGRPAPQSGAPGARFPGDSGAYPSRPPAYGPTQVHPAPGAYGYGPPPGATGPVPGRPYPQGPAQPTHAFGGYPAATGGAPTASTTVTTPEKPKRDLTVPKLAAGAGAAATSAVLGSFFGDTGTVSGAALGSVFSAIVTWVYERSLERTGQTVKAKIKLPGGRTVDVSGKTEVAPPIAAGGETGQARVYVTPADVDRPTEVMSVVPGAAAGSAPKKTISRKRVLVLTGFAVLVFAIGMLAVTGIELVKGSPLSKTSSSTSTRSGGTSLGSVLGGGSNAASTGAGTTEKATSEESATDEPTAEETSSPSTDEDSPTTAPRRSGVGADESAAPSRSAKATPTPTPTPNVRSGGGSDTGAGANVQVPLGNGGGGAAAPPQREQQ